MLATVVLSVNPSLLYLIGDPVDSVAVWKELEDVCSFGYHLFHLTAAIHLSHLPLSARNL